MAAAAAAARIIINNGIWHKAEIIKA